MRLKGAIAVIIILLLIAVPIALSLFGDWVWFLSMGYEAVFLRILLTSVSLGIGAFVVFFAVSYAGIWLAKRAALGKGKRKTHTSKTNALIAIAAIAGFVLAVAMANQWEAVLKYLNYSAFASSDPVFGMNTGFYAFTLPFYSLVVNFLLATFIMSAILAAVSYAAHSLGLKMGTIESEGGDWTRGPFTGRRHRRMSMSLSGSWQRFVPLISILLFLIFAVIAANIWLAQYGLLFSSGGAVYGAGYTDVNVTLSLLQILSVVSLVIGVLFLANIRIKKSRFIREGILAFVIIAALGFVISGAVQVLIVGPNEFNLEKPYIERNIQGTLAAYGMDAAEENTFSVGYDLTSADIARNNASIGNIRLWDWRPLQQTYHQLQLFRTYYEFNDIDIDRYALDGAYKQVMVSAREMNTDELPAQAQTWVNRHLVYTHGYGVVMNPVDRVSSDGLPVFYIKDIPPTSQYLNIDQPQIYYGEKVDDYVITGTSTDELDYPSGDENIYTPYAGTGGVMLSDVIRRLAYAVKFRSLELLVSGSIKPDSRLLMYRNIMNRVSAIAPFLSYDPDPYIVVSDGRLYWIMDAYTTTDMYPYSEPVRAVELGKKSFNYMRNSVKVVVDAYNGDVYLYVIDPADPLIQTYQKMFPAMFLDFAQMPDDLKAHIRYPEGLFSVQAYIYSTYHMKDPRVFYNKEDVWVIPDEIYSSSRQQMIPYYIIMKLPGSDKEEFILMIPFTPKGKENLIGWMAARADVPNYGKVIVYQFSKQELTYGPMQVEARVDQDTEISQLITLWSQSGSDVLRGNTLVIPIENSILYIEPLYLEATERGTLPQLQRVIVAYGNKLTMQKTLTEALNVIFGAAPPSTGPAPPTPAETAGEKLAQIAELYQKAQDALKAGDLSLYQQYINQIGSIAG